jgi:hypothetical protein
MAARLAQLEEDAYNIKVHTRRQPGDHPDPSLHLHQTEDGQWERQVTLDSLARKYKNALPRTMATQQNLVEDLHLLKKSIGHEQVRCVPMRCVVLLVCGSQRLHALSSLCFGGQTGRGGQAAVDARKHRSSLCPASQRQPHSQGGCEPLLRISKLGVFTSAFYVRESKWSLPHT